MIVVTGATGHIGNNLIPLLLERGHTVRALVHSNKGRLDAQKVDIVEGDVRDRASLDRAFEGAEYVLHLAAKISIVGDPDGSVHAINVDGARNVAEAALAAGVKRLVHTSSCHAFDINRVPSDTAAGTADETCGRPGPGHPAYDRSKALGEAQVREVIAKGLDAVIVNPSGVIGPNDPEPSRMGHTFLWLASGTMPSLIDGGFDFVDVRDVCDGILGALKLGKTGENYLLSGHHNTVGQLAEHVQALTGTKPPMFTSPMWLARFGAPFVELWYSIVGGEPIYTAEALHALRANPLSHAKAVADIGYSARSTRESVTDILESFRGDGRL
ncbi:MAG: NAD-dependent epimerase/dehydratase family protein [Proteobacteria bacterium]|nr:NAD-dependent epimerase/dehydratase family protein [Pseudomonadota bacterium]